jgi:hypothetical protein
VSASERVAPIASTSLLFLDAREPPIRRFVSPGAHPDGMQSRICTKSSLNYRKYGKYRNYEGETLAEIPRP